MAPDSLAGGQPQYRAAVTLPGYTASGRNAGRASWWPVPGDSVVVHVVGARGNRVQLRGSVNGTSLRGEIWLISAETGTTYQIGEFNATRLR